MVSPARFNEVIKIVNEQLPRGWSISSDELWVAFRGSTATVAAMENSFHLFIQVPIFDHAQQYKLFQIINLPGATDNGTHGVIFGNLPDFHAVSADLETFLELTKDDVKDCSKIGRPQCKFHTGISKRNARKSCAIAVFLNDSQNEQKMQKEIYRLAWPRSSVLRSKPMGLLSITNSRNSFLVSLWRRTSSSKNSNNAANRDV